MAKSRHWWLVIAGVFALLAIYILGPVLTPFAIALLFAYLLDPLVRKIEHYIKNRTLATLLVLSSFFLIALLFLFIIIPILQRQILYLIHSIPSIMDWITNTLIPWLQQKINLNIEHIQPEQIKEIVLNNFSQTSNWVKRFIGLITESGFIFIAWVINCALIPLVMFYFMRDWNPLITKLNIYLPTRYRANSTKLISRCDEVLSAFIRGHLIVMLCLGIMYSIGLAIVGIKMSLLIGLIAGLFSIVPYLGVVTGLIASLITAFFQFGSFFALVKVCFVFAIAHIIEGFFLTPVLVGDKIGLHPVMVIFAVLAGGKLFGFVGTLLALPVAAVLTVFIRHMGEQYLDSQFYKN